MVKKNFLAVINASVGKVIDALRRLKDYCDGRNFSEPFGELDFQDLFYLIHVHKDVNEIPLGLAKFMFDYALDYEEEIIDEIMETDGIYDGSEKNILPAKELLVLAEYYKRAPSKNPGFWDRMSDDMLETFPQIGKEINHFNKYVMDKNVKSVFMFRAFETMREFEQKLRTFHKDDVASAADSFSVTFTVAEKDYQIKFVLDSLDGQDVWKITNGKNDYLYLVKEAVDWEGGLCIVFEGPILALWQQHLLPRISYVPETLCGKLATMDEFVPINEYMKKRLEKNGGNVGEQDRYGYKVNKVFHNEIEALPKYSGYTGENWKEKTPYKYAEKQRRKKKGEK